MTRKEVLDAAQKCVNGDRDLEYRSPEKSFELIAYFWTNYLNAVRTGTGTAIKPKDVAAMMALFKIARIAGGHAKDDNWIDLAGYAACGGEIESSTNARALAHLTK